MNKIPEELRQRRIKETYEEFKRVEALYTKREVRLIGTPILHARRNKLLQRLYRLGESSINISIKTGWSIALVSAAVRENEELMRDLSLFERFCNFCGNEFKPDRITQLFCRRKCFKAAYYREHLAEARRYYDINTAGVVKKNKISPSLLPKRKCLECSESFVPDVPTQKFCSRLCRSRFHTKIVNERLRNNRFKKHD